MSDVMPALSFNIPILGVVGGARRCCLGGSVQRSCKGEALVDVVKSALLMNPKYSAL